VRGLDPDQEKPESRLLRLFEYPGIPGHVNPCLDGKGLLYIVLDNHLAKPFAAFGIGEEVVVAEEHKICLDRLQFFDDRFERPFRVAPLLPERIEAERAELAFERTSPCCQYRVERAVAESNTVLNPVIIVPSQASVGKRNVRDIRQRVDFVVDDLAVLAIGKPENITVRDPCNDLFDYLFALTPHYHVDIRTLVEQVLDFLRCFVAAYDRADIAGQLGDEITDALELRTPSDADA